MPKKTEKSEWSRECPKCGKPLYYAGKRNLQRAIDNGRPCNTCRVISEDQKKKISVTLKSKGYKPHIRPKDSEIEKISNLPDKQELYYQVASSLNAPIIKLARVLSSVPQKFVRVIDAVREKKTGEVV